MSILGRHTAQLKQLSLAVSQVSAAVVQQGDDISFVLREQMAMKTQQNEMMAQQSEMTTQQGKITTQQDGMTGKLDLILQLLQKPGR